jgi:hypothetical protein
MVTAAHPFDPALLAAANICPVTGLATDYLNHFNEIAMLVDMAGYMREALEEILAWRPRSYRDHFHITGFRDRDLAIEAYEACDPFVRAEFDAACGAVAEAILQIQEDLAAGAIDLTEAPARAFQLYALIAGANACVLGRTPEGASADQAAIDALFD